MPIRQFDFSKRSALATIVNPSPELDLIDFTRRTFSLYRADPVHGLIARALGEVIDGKTKRLMIFAPPQHGKSELVSVRLPALWLARRPDDPVILSSYAASLAYTKSYQARGVVESDEFIAMFPSVRTDQASRAKDHWNLSKPHRGSMLAAGVGGSVTGHGAMLGIIDDPFENWEQAQSATIRERVWDWWRGTFRTRIWEHGAVVLIMTRWHQDDLAGRLLLDQPGEWTVLRLPAIAETQDERDQAARRIGLPLGAPDPLGRSPGEPLAPTRFSLAALVALKRDVGSMVWAAEYQGNPAAAEGNRFRRHWFKIIDIAPVDIVQWFRYWDKAASINGKRTAGVKIGKARDGRIVIAHTVAGQWTTLERRQVMLQTAQMDGKDTHIVIEQEPGSSGVDSVQDEIRMLVGFPVFADRPSGDKDTRLEPFAAQAEAGNVFLVRGEWNEAYIDEMLAVPNGAFRDRADATAGGFNRLAKRSVASMESYL